MYTFVAVVTAVVHCVYCMEEDNVTDVLAGLFAALKIFVFWSACVIVVTGAMQAHICVNF